MRNSYRVKLFLLCLSTFLTLCACQDLTPPANQSTSMETIETSNSPGTETSNPSNIIVDSHSEAILPGDDNLKWEYSAKLMANTVFLANDDIVVVQSDDAMIGGLQEESCLIGLDANSGTPIWSIDIFLKSFLLHADTLFILERTGNNEYKLTAYDTKNGSQKWSSTYDKIEESQQLFVIQDYLYLNVKYDENNSGLYLINTKTGKTEAEHPLDSNTYVYSNGINLFYVDVGQMKIQSLNMNLKLIWTINNIDFLFIDSNYANTSGIIAYIKNNLCYVDLANGQVKNYQLKDNTDLLAYINAKGSKYQYCDDFVVYNDWLSMIIGNRNYLLSTTNSQAIISDTDERMFLVGNDIVSYKNNVVSCKTLNGRVNKWEIELPTSLKVMNNIVSYKDMLILWVSTGYVLCDNNSGRIIKQVFYNDSAGNSIEFYPRSYVYNLYKSEKFLFLPRLFGLECYSIE